jgi:hypothetical protein
VSENWGETRKRRLALSSDVQADERSEKELTCGNDQKYHVVIRGMSILICLVAAVGLEPTTYGL